ncbi:MAG TPA: carbohydrate-binding protein [Pilimelia sp.]|nr:carbohydrate-binding protein [Pilimelia sp.]
MRINTRRLLAGLVTVAAVAAGALTGSAAHAQTLREGRVAYPTFYSAEAESYDAQWGTKTVWSDRASGRRLVTSLSQGDWLRYDNVTGEEFWTSVMCVVGHGPAGVDLATVELRLGSRWAPPLTTFPVRTYLGPGSREWVWANPLPPGTHTVYLTVSRTHGVSSFDLDYIIFSKGAPPPSLTC